MQSSFAPPQPPSIRNEKDPNLHGAESDDLSAIDIVSRKNLRGPCVFHSLGSLGAMRSSRKTGRNERYVSLVSDFQRNGQLGRAAESGGRRAVGRPFRAVRGHGNVSHLPSTRAPDGPEGPS